MERAERVEVQLRQRRVHAARAARLAHGVRVNTRHPLGALLAPHVRNRVVAAVGDPRDVVRALQHFAVLLHNITFFKCSCPLTW